MDCQYGCGRRGHDKLNACLPCYRLVHGKDTADEVLQWIAGKKYSENDAVFKIEKFLLERSQEYLRVRLRRLLDERWSDDRGKCARKFLKRVKQIPADLLSSLNNFYQFNPLDDEEFLDLFDNDLTFYCGRKYGRSSSDEEEMPGAIEGHNEESVGSCSGGAKKRSCTPTSFPSGNESDECFEPPKKKQAQNIKKNAFGRKRSRSTIDMEEDVEVTPSKKRAGETATSTIDDSSVMNLEVSLPPPDQDLPQLEVMEEEPPQPLKPKRFRRRKRSELELLQVCLPPYFRCKIPLSPPQEVSSPAPPTQAMSAPKPLGYVEKRGRPKKKPSMRLRDNLGRFAKDPSKQPQQPRRKIRTRRTELQLLKAGLPPFFSMLNVNLL